MRTIIAGSRTITDIRWVVKGVAECGWQISTVVCGKARGVDTLGEMWAKRNNIAIDYYPAQWGAYGKRAGYIRNGVMAENADALLLIWDGQSKGSEMMLALAKAKGLRVHIIVVLVPLRRVD